MAENFPKSMTDTKTEIQDVERTPSRMHTKKSKSKHIQIAKNLTQRNNLERSQREK